MCEFDQRWKSLYFGQFCHPKRAPRFHYKTYKRKRPFFRWVYRKYHNDNLCFHGAKILHFDYCVFGDRSSVFIEFYVQLFPRGIDWAQENGQVHVGGHQERLQ